MIINALSAGQIVTSVWNATLRTITSVMSTCSRSHGVSGQTLAAGISFSLIPVSGRVGSFNLTYKTDGSSTATRNVIDDQGNSFLVATLANNIVQSIMLMQVNFGTQIVYHQITNTAVAGVVTITYVGQEWL